MVNAVILMNVKRDSIPSVAETLADLPGVSEVYSVGGRYDLVAIIRVANNDDLATLVTEQIRAIDAIVNTETLIAFRAFSRHDLDSMFSIGLN
ncbi:MAG: Lrp/AsnC ligand binding domain-containing protein [Caldilineaceae bacterium]|nr:Lrp/AsnC ligand binding domain-containing protein [Caldilineaceae bacterium]